MRAYTGGNGGGQNGGDAVGDHYIYDPVARSDSAKNGVVSKLRGCDFGRLHTHCQLHRELMEGAPLDHSETWGLASNLLAMSGGQQELELGLSRRAEWSDPIYRARKSMEMEEMKRKGYKPEACGKYCQYSQKCPNAGNLQRIAKRGRHDVLRPAESAKRVPLVEAEAALAAAFEAMRNDEYDLLLIKAETGLGKSRHIWQERNSIIAVPTHALGRQSHEDMVKSGNQNVCLVPEVPAIRPSFDHQLELCRRLGAHKEANSLIHQECERIERLPEADRSPDEAALLIYRDSLEQLRKGGRSVIITHARLLLSDIREALVRQGHSR